MTILEHQSAAARPPSARPDHRPKRYDIRVVDQFFGYCQAVARTHRHRDEAQLQSQFATRRNIATLVLAGGLFCYYLIERLSQVIGLL